MTQFIDILSKFNLDEVWMKSVATNMIPNELLVLLSPHFMQNFGPLLIPSYNRQTNVHGRQETLRQRQTSFQQRHIQ